MDTSSKMELRHLPLAPRLVLSMFLVSVGCGYLSALVQLHFQHARPGNLLPSLEDARKIYYGSSDVPQSPLERLLEAPAERPFNGTGQMRAAFTDKSKGWTKALRNKSDDEKAAILQAREGERLALLDWIRGGAQRESYDSDKHTLSTSLGQHPLSDEFLVKTDAGQPAEPHQVAIKSLLEARCVDCHSEGGRFSEAAKFPLDKYELIKPYTEVKNASGMSLQKLAQTTHVHLISFSILYGLTGLIFAFTSYPCWLRLVVAPLPLAAQLVDVSCWWLARYDPRFVQVIMVTGGLIAGGLFLHIVLSLFNMYGSHGKKVVLLLLALTAAGGFFAKTKIIDPFLENERLATVVAE